jgi:hypothetical protein
LMRNAQLLPGGRLRAKRQENDQKLSNVPHQQDCFAGNDPKRIQALRFNELRSKWIHSRDKSRRSTRSLLDAQYVGFGPPTPHKSQHAEDRGRKWFQKSTWVPRREKMALLTSVTRAHRGAASLGAAGTK